MTDTYKENFRQYRAKFCFGDYGINNTEKLKLICLICYLTKKLREKNQNVMVMDVIIKIIPDYNTYSNFLQNISFACESLLDDGNGVIKQEPYPVFGLKTPKEIVDEIRRILSFYLPF